MRHEGRERDIRVTAASRDVASSRCDVTVVAQRCLSVLRCAQSRIAYEARRSCFLLALAAPAAAQTPASPPKIELRTRSSRCRTACT